MKQLHSGTKSLLGQKEPITSGTGDSVTMNKQSQ